MNRSDERLVFTIDEAAQALSTVFVNSCGDEPLRGSCFKPATGFTQAIKDDRCKSSLQAAHRC